MALAVYCLWCLQGSCTNVRFRFVSLYITLFLASIWGYVCDVPTSIPREGDIYVCGTRFT